VTKRSISKIRFYFSVSALYALTLLFVATGLGVRIFPSAPPKIVQAQAPAPIPPKTFKVTASKPNRILIPSLKIDLAVTDGAYDAKKKTWTLSDNHAHFALPSAEPNNFAGNTLIYGHKYDWIFGGLKDLKPGDKMQLFGENGHVFTYIYENTQKLKPDDATAFRYDGKPTVSVQTCSGRWNENRQMFNFRLEKAV
jgi:LPXTG-site transpeptidase (sortase) family protein